jgi:hypothetical protein
MGLVVVRSVLVPERLRQDEAGGVEGFGIWRQGAGTEAGSAKGDGEPQTYAPGEPGGHAGAAAAREAVQVRAAAVLRAGRYVHARAACCRSTHLANGEAGPSQEAPRVRLRKHVHVCVHTHHAGAADTHSGWKHLHAAGVAQARVGYALSNGTGDALVGVASVRVLVSEVASELVSYPVMALLVDPGAGARAHACAHCLHPRATDPQRWLIYWAGAGRATTGAFAPVFLGKTATAGMAKTVGARAFQAKALTAGEAMDVRARVFLANLALVHVENGVPAAASESAGVNLKGTPRRAPSPPRSPVLFRARARALPLVLSVESMAVLILRIQ